MLDLVNGTFKPYRKPDNITQALHPHAIEPFPEHHQTSPYRYQETAVKPLCKRGDIQSSNTILQKNTLSAFFHLQPNSKQQPRKEATKKENHLVQSTF